MDSTAASGRRNTVGRLTIKTEQLSDSVADLIAVSAGLSGLSQTESARVTISQAMLDAYPDLRRRVQAMADVRQISFDAAWAECIDLGNNKNSRQQNQTKSNQPPT